MARRLAGELPVSVYDIDAGRRAALAAEGARDAASPAEAARDADVVVLAVRDQAQVEGALFGENGAADALRPGAVVILTSTVGPEAARSTAERLAERGVLTVDAPVSGGPVRAGDGDLLIVVGAEDVALKAARPVLDLLASTLTVVGPRPGDGQAMKAVNQLLAGVHIAAASEAITFAAKQGLDIRKVYEVITASAGNSWMFENRMPHVLDGDYAPRSAVEIFVKDLGIIQDMARSQKFPVPVAAAALQMFLMTAASGMGRDDDASVARMYARVTGTHLPGEPK
jgi:3-hydroxyisobutyrate dehydrogenase